jgi:hypothetical protein
MKRTVQQRIPRDITKSIQRVGHFLHDIVMPVMQNIRYIFHQQRQRPRRLHPGRILLIRYVDRLLVFLCESPDLGNLMWPGPPPGSLGARAWKRW